MQRASYHTTLKELVSLDLLPNEYLGKIPRTNIHRWRNDDFKRYKGSELNEIADKHRETIDTLNKFPKLFYAAGRLAKTLMTVAASTDNFEKKMREHKEKIVDTLIHVKQTIPISKAVKFFGISKGTFHAWVIDTKVKCSKSFFKQCIKTYPNQVTSTEVQAVKEALINPRTAHWSMRSIYYKGLRDGKITVSEGTLYKINRTLGIRKTKKKKKKRRKEGIKASSPNQFWHTDITKVQTEDGNWYCVYLLMDNYSRRILSHEVKDKVSGLVTKSLIEHAYHRAKWFTNDLNVNLIVDGGPENNNIYVENFISKSEINMKKLIALKDIKKSNSMIERVNRILKYQYIFPKEPRDKKHLIRLLQYSINDYNKVRPHSTLKGATPDEVWKGAPVNDDLRTMVLKTAKSNRKEENKANRCDWCS